MTFAPNSPISHSIRAVVCGAHQINTYSIKPVRIILLFPATRHCSEFWVRIYVAILKLLITRMLSRITSLFTSSSVEFFNISLDCYQCYLCSSLKAMLHEAIFLATCLATMTTEKHCKLQRGVSHVRNIFSQLATPPVEIVYDSFSAILKSLASKRQDLIA